MKELNLIVLKTNSYNKIIKQKCVETGEKLVYANTEKNVNTLMEILNLNQNKEYPNITKQETVNSSIKKVIVPTEPDVYSFMYTKINLKKFNHP